MILVCRPCTRSWMHLCKLLKASSSPYSAAMTLCSASCAACTHGLEASRRGQASRLTVARRTRILNNASTWDECIGGGILAATLSYFPRIRCGLVVVGRSMCDLRALLLSIDPGLVCAPSR